MSINEGDERNIGKLFLQVAGRAHNSSSFVDYESVVVTEQMLASQANSMPRC
jgi:hypothetical protein